MSQKELANHTPRSESEWGEYALEESLNILWSYEGTEDADLSHEIIIDFLCENIQLSIVDAHSLLSSAIEIHQMRVDSGFYENCSDALLVKHWNQ